MKRTRAIAPDQKVTAVIVRETLSPAIQPGGLHKADQPSRDDVEQLIETITQAQDTIMQAVNELRQAGRGMPDFSFYEAYPLAHIDAATGVGEYHDQNNLEKWKKALQEYLDSGKAGEEAGPDEEKASRPRGLRKVSANGLRSQANRFVSAWDHFRAEMVHAIEAGINSLSEPPDQNTLRTLQRAVAEMQSDSKDLENALLDADSRLSGDLEPVPQTADGIITNAAAGRGLHKAVPDSAASMQQKLLILTSKVYENFVELTGDTRYLRQQLYATSIHPTDAVVKMINTLISNFTGEASILKEALEYNLDNAGPTGTPGGRTAVEQSASSRGLRKLVKGTSVSSLLDSIIGGATYNIRRIDDAFIQMFDALEEAEKGGVKSRNLRSVKEFIGGASDHVNAALQSLERARSYIGPDLDLSEGSGASSSDSGAWVLRPNGMRKAEEGGINLDKLKDDMANFINAAQEMEMLSRSIDAAMDDYSSEEEPEDGSPFGKVYEAWGEAALISSRLYDITEKLDPLTYGDWTDAGQPADSRKAIEAPSTSLDGLLKLRALEVNPLVKAQYAKQIERIRKDAAAE